MGKPFSDWPGQLSITVRWPLSWAGVPWGAPASPIRSKRQYPPRDLVWFSGSWGGVCSCLLGACYILSPRSRWKPSPKRTVFPTVVQTQDPCDERRPLLGVPLSPWNVPSRRGGPRREPRSLCVSLQAERVWLSDVYSQRLTPRSRRADFSQDPPLSCPVCTCPARVLLPGTRFSFLS